MPHAEVGGVDGTHRIWFETYGSGKQKVIFIMGFSCTLRGRKMFGTTSQDARHLQI